MSTKTLLWIIPKRQVVHHTGIFACARRLLVYIRQLNHLVLNKIHTARLTELRRQLFHAGSTTDAFRELQEYKGGLCVCMKQKNKSESYDDDDHDHWSWFVRRPISWDSGNCAIVVLCRKIIKEVFYRIGILSRLSEKKAIQINNISSFPNNNYARPSISDESR